MQYLIPGGIFNRELASIPDRTTPDQNDGGGDDDDNSNVGRETVVKIAAYNVLGFSHDTSASRYGNHERMRRAAGLLKSQGVEIAVVNEINEPLQRTILLDNLPGWKGTQLQTGNQDALVLWDSGKYTALNTGTYNIPYLAGGDARPQAWVKFKHRDSNRELFVFGTHLPRLLVAGGDNQREAARITIDKIRSRAGDAPFILAGDMNSYRGLPGRDDAYDVFKQYPQLLRDARTIADTKGNDNCDTHHRLGEDTNCRHGYQVDQIWVSRNQGVTVDLFKVIVNSETMHISDHNPVIAKIRIPRSN